MAFLDEFYRDYKVRPDGWRNNKLEIFLEALAAWARDMDGFYLNKGAVVPESPEWKTFAQMLAAATMYE
ncbi:MAG: hypothetical protein WBG02_02325 [Candidatus Acidiferrum sp.]